MKQLGLNDLVKYNRQKCRVKKITKNHVELVSKRGQYKLPLEEAEKLEVLENLEEKN